MDELIQRWRELKAIRDPTLPQLTEQFHLAQALTSSIRPTLYLELNRHRARCVEFLRTAPQKLRRTQYTVMSSNRPPRRPVWHEIEITPDISFTMSTELVGTILPTHYTRLLRRMIKLQVSILEKEIP